MLWAFRFMVALLHESLQLYCQMAALSQKLTQHHTDHNDMSVIQRWCYTSSSDHSKEYLHPHHDRSSATTLQWTCSVSSLTSRVYTLLLHLQKKCNTYIASGQDFHLFIPMVDYSFSETFIPPQKKNTACFTYYILDLRCKRHIKSNFK